MRRGPSACLMSESTRHFREVPTVRKLILTGIAGLVLATPAAAAPTTLMVAMRDPGCHWFYLGGRPGNRTFAKTVIRHGPLTLVNLDQASMMIMSPCGTN